MRSRAGLSSQHCGAVRVDGSPCRAWAVRGSQPPRCVAHSGKQETSGSGLGAGSPERDLTQIEAVIADLAERQGQLTAYLKNRLAEGTDVEEVAKLFALHGQNASRLGRLLRDQLALSGESADEILDAISKALDEISADLGIEL